MEKLKYSLRDKLPASLSPEQKNTILADLEAILALSDEGAAAKALPKIVAS